MDSYASPELQLSCARTRKRDMGGGTFIYLYGVRNNSLHRHNKLVVHSQRKGKQRKHLIMLFFGKKKGEFQRLECAGDARPSWTARYLTRRGFKSSDHPTWGPAHAAGRQPVRARPFGPDKLVGSSLDPGRLWACAPIGPFQVCHPLHSQSLSLSQIKYKISSKKDKIY